MQIILSNVILQATIWAIEVNSSSVFQTLFLHQNWIFVPIFFYEIVLRNCIFKVLFNDFYIIYIFMISVNLNFDLNFKLTIFKECM